MSEYSGNARANHILRLNTVPNCTFEASLVWRSLLKAFPLTEHVIDCGTHRIYYWLHPLYNKAISTPFRDRLALEWDAGFEPSDLHLSRLAKEIRRKNVVIKDIERFASISDTTNGVTQLGLVQDYVNCEVILDGDIEKRFKYSTRKNLRKAEEDYGLSIRINPDGAFEGFYALYLQSRRRLGVLPYPEHFFKELFALLGDAVVLFECSSPKETIGYLICYLHGQEMISGHLAYDFEKRQMRISDFLFVSAFQWGREHGFTTYRFGADNRNQTTLLDSKQKLGAIARDQWVFHKCFKEAVVDNPESLTRRILRRMPMEIFQHSGSITKLYFG